MHSPEVVVFDIHIPIPSIKWKVNNSKWKFKRRRYNTDGDPHPLNNKPMYSWWSPKAWELVLNGRLMGWLDIGTVWHYDPDGADSGSVCKGMKSSEFSWHNLKWAWKHRKHIEIHWRHYRKYHRWLFDRCDRCGLPFRGNYRTVIGEWSGDRMWHTHCSTIRSQQGTIKVLASYISDGSDEWLANYWAKQIVERESANER
jgi:hypothetical protein